jgi:hypothetical protein
MRDIPIAIIVYLSLLDILSLRYPRKARESMKRVESRGAPAGASESPLVESPRPSRAARGSKQDEVG